MFRSVEEARDQFRGYSQIEPRLEPLWDLCRRAAPPSRSAVQLDDEYDVDAFDFDAVATGEPDDGWCAEDHFHRYVKPKLMKLAGSLRPGPPHELHKREAYDALYDLLINWALPPADG